MRKFDEIQLNQNEFKHVFQGRLTFFPRTNIIGKIIPFFFLFFGASLNLFANTSDSVEVVSPSLRDGKNFKIKIDLKQQQVKVFKNDFLIKEMPCSTGMIDTPTPVGSFMTYEKIKSNQFETDGITITYYYLTKFNGDIAFHSKIFGNHPFVEEGERKFEKGEPSSMGCIRLLLSDAKWIYDKIGLGASVEVY